MQQLSQDLRFHMLCGLANSGGHRQTHGTRGLQPDYMRRLQASSAMCPSVSHPNLLSQTAFHKAARFHTLLLSCNACIRLVCELLQRKRSRRRHRLLSKLRKQRREKQKSKKAKQKVTVSGIWQEVYKVSSLSWLSEETKGKYANSANATAAECRISGHMPVLPSTFCCCWVC